MFKKIFSFLVPVAFAATVIAYLVYGFGDTHSSLLGYLYLIPPALASIAGFFLVHTYSLKSQKGVSMLLITLGILNLFIGELIWAYQQLFLDVELFPSIADLFYHLAYPFLLFGFFREVHSAGLSWWDKKNRVPTALTIVLAGVVGLSLLYFGVFNQYSADSSALENFVAATYGIGDIALLTLLVFILKIAFEYRTGKMFRPWLWMTLGVFTMLVADYLYIFLYDPYELGTGIIFVGLDILWTASYFFFGLSFIKMDKAISEVSMDILKKKE